VKGGDASRADSENSLNSRLARLEQPSCKGRLHRLRVVVSSRARRRLLLKGEKSADLPVQRSTKAAYFAAGYLVAWIGFTPRSQGRDEPETTSIAHSITTRAA
jgi:hypothetical protein